MRPTVLPPSEIRRVLVHCPNWLGDTVMAVPTLRALRAALPGVELWCLGPWAGPLLEAEPGIARCLELPRGWRARLGVARRLRDVGIDLALVLASSFGSALFEWLAGARWRLGYAGDGRAWLLTHPVSPATAPPHQVGAYLALLAVLGVRPQVVPPTLRVGPARRVEALRLLSEAGVSRGERAIGIHLGAAFGPSKLWPTDRLAELATRLEARRIPVVFLGSASAVALLRVVEATKRGPVRSLVGRDHPALLPALLREFSVLVGPDSGPAHVAAAVGVPGVTLFGPTDPRLTAPMGDGQTVLWRRPLCAPCFQPRCPIDHRCLDEITVDEVEAAVLSRLQHNPGREGGSATP